MAALAVFVSMLDGDRQIHAIYGSYDGPDKIGAFDMLCQNL